MNWFLAYAAIGVLTNIWTMAQWRRRPDWRRHWSDYAFYPFWILPLTIWPVILPYVIRDEWRYWFSQEEEQENA